MGISFSCPFATYNDVESDLQSIVVKSVCLGDVDSKTPKRSISFKGQDDSEPMILRKSLGSGKMILEGSVSFKQRETDTLISIDAPSMDNLSLKSNGTVPLQSPIVDVDSPKHEAAVKLQKVYKSFCTRRKLADCAVLVEQSWWKLLDFAELKHSSISFFDIEHNETAISRWFRAKTRAAKVGKGLSKNGKAQKLALQHWLEAIDPRHRYGHNLHFYYTEWLESHSKEPFFYWLDIGGGKEVNLVEKCPRWKLQQQCIKYLGPMERRVYEVAVKDGEFFYRETGELVDTSVEPQTKWIFVLSTSRTLYVGKKKKGTFQHSSFLAGGATSAAGRLVVENGILKAVWPHSGHYRPTPENFQEFISFLGENDVDLTHVKMNPVDEDEPSFGKQRSSLHWISNSPEEDVVPENDVETNRADMGSITKKKPESSEHETAAVPEHCHSRPFTRKLTNLQIPRRDTLFIRMQSELLASEPSDGYDSAAEAELEAGGEIIPKESILKRINSHKEAKSYQLGKQLSCKWTTGAGPRIGCVRDYPSELQFRALEQVSLSPRQVKLSQSPGFSSKLSTPNPVVQHISIGQCKRRKPTS